MLVGTILTASPLESLGSTGIYVRELVWKVWLDRSGSSSCVDGFSNSVCGSFNSLFVIIFLSDVGMCFV